MAAAAKRPTPDTVVHPAAPPSAPTAMRARLAVFVALGSRGDVQPLAIIAHHLVQSTGTRVAFVTHRELCAVVAHLAPGVELRPLDSPCFLGDKHDLSRPLCVVDTEGRRRKEWVAVTKLARDADVLVANLFALPSTVHLSEKLGVPQVVCTPCLVPYACPDDFEEQFRGEMPELSAMLDRGEICITWDDVRTWLWPLWTYRHGLFREHFLQLPTCPFVDKTGQAADTWGQRRHGAPTLVVGIDPRFVAAGGRDAADSSGGAHSATVAAPAPDAQAARRTNKASPQRWALPIRSRVVGFWSQPPPPALPDNVPFDFATPPVFVTFGQMVTLLPEVDSAELLAAIRDAVAACGRIAAVQWPHWIDNAGTMIRLPADVPHNAVLPLCCAAIHHGGIGTAAACARAGVPQVIHPLAFDQPYNSTVIQRLGIGVAAPTLADIRPALERALADPVAGAARAWVDDSGDAVATACDIISERLALPYFDDVVATTASAATPSAGTRPVLSPWQADLSLPLQLPQWCAVSDDLRVRSTSVSEAEWVYGEIFRDRCYTPPGIRVWPGMACVDVGGGIGLFAIFAKRVLRAGTVTSIEPAPDSFARYVENVQTALKLGPPTVAGNASVFAAGGVTVHQCACDAEARDGTMLFYPGLPSNACLYEHADEKRAHISREGALNVDIAEYLTYGEHEVAVRCLPLSSLLPPRSISLLKVDVEGHEASVLAGVADADWARIQQVAMEIHSEELLAQCRTVLNLHYCTVWHVDQAIPGHSLLYATRNPTSPSVGSTLQ